MLQGLVVLQLHVAEFLFQRSVPSRGSKCQSSLSSYQKPQGFIFARPNQSSLEYSDSLRLQPALQVLNSSLSFLVLLSLLQDTKLGNGYFTIEKRRIT